VTGTVPGELGAIATPGAYRNPVTCQCEDTAATGSHGSASANLLVGGTGAFAYVRPSDYCPVTGTGNGNVNARGHRSGR
jgi:hypothetical protein